jgi:enoyl-CoA hydratase/carnithine racemase
MAHVMYEQRDGIGYVTLNRPEILNALADDTIVELRQALYALDEDDNAQVGILSGNGRAFCSGADVRQRQLRSREEMLRLGGAQGRDSYLQDLLWRFANWKPLIASIHGYCLGGGLRVALQCELIVASKDTQFQVTEVSRGVDGTGFWMLLNNRGAGAFASDVCLTGRFWDAEEGLRNGVINRVAPEGKHLEVAEELARQIIANPPLAVRAVVEARRGAIEEVELRAKLSRPRTLHLTDDFHESALAFIEKREPVFSGS